MRPVSFDLDISIQSWSLESWDIQSWRFQLFVGYQSMTRLLQRYRGGRSGWITKRRTGQIYDYSRLHKGCNKINIKRWLVASGAAAAAIAVIIKLKTGLLVALRDYCHVTYPRKIVYIAPPNPLRCEGGGAVCGVATGSKWYSIIPHNHAIRSLVTVCHFLHLHNYTTEVIWFSCWSRDGNNSRLCCLSYHWNWLKYL